VSPAVLDIARARAAELGISVELVERDAEALPLDDNTFDTVVCALSLCTIPNNARAVAETARVLKPGGTLCWTTSAAPGRPSTPHNGCWSASPSVSLGDTSHDASSPLSTRLASRSWSRSASRPAPSSASTRSSRTSRELAGISGVQPKA